MTKLETIAEEARIRWTNQVGVYGQDAEWQPSVFVLDGETNLRCAAVLDVLVDAPVPMFEVALHLASTLVNARTTWVAVVVDTFQCQDPFVSQMVRQGILPPLSELHASGYPGVLDCLVAQGCSRDGITEIIAMPYVRTGSNVEWRPHDSVAHPDSHFDGTMVTKLRELLARSGN